jgi:hypothetical protein
MRIEFAYALALICLIVITLALIHIAWGVL